MAMFKVGQRVKVVGHVLEPGNMDFRGLCGTVLGHESDYNLGLTVVVELDGKRSFGGYCFAPEELAPLTDPKADEFIESIKKLKPLHEEPKVQRTKQDA
jgi:hypothetical protein